MSKRFIPYQERREQNSAAPWVVIGVGSVALSVLYASGIGNSIATYLSEPAIDCSEGTHEITLHDGPLVQVSETVSGNADPMEVVDYVVELNGLDTSYGTSDLGVGTTVTVPDSCESNY